MAAFAHVAQFLRRHPDQVEWLSREKRSGAYAANKARILDACTARATEWDASTRAVFDAVYKGAGHLQFLSMHAGEALEILRRQAGTVGPLLAHAQLEALENADWRPHLVSCVAAFIQPPTPAVLAALWEAGPRSWVAPQIAATLSVVDSGFARGVKDLLDGIRDVPQKPPPPPPREYTPEELGQIAALFDPSKADPARQRQLRAQARAHSQRGPSWGLAPAAKWISALCGLADVDAATRARPDLVRLAEYAEAGDWGEFARRWRSAAQKAVG